MGRQMSENVLLHGNVNKKGKGDVGPFQLAIEEGGILSDTGDSL